MYKVWLIARHQYAEEVFKRSFLIALLSLPLFLAVSIGSGYLTQRFERKRTTLGYVDQAGLLSEASAVPETRDVRIVRFETAEEARIALDAGQADAYYILSADYADTHGAELVYFEPPDYRATRYFRDIVRQKLLDGQSPATTERALYGANVTVRATEYKRDFPLRGPGVNQLVPLIAAVIFAFLVLTASGTLMQAVVVEKENRTMEVIVSSVSPGKMMAGKIIGMIGMALTVLLVWLAFFAGAVWLGRFVLEIGWLQTAEPNWIDVLKVVIVAFPSFLFIAALMATVGATMVEVHEVQQAGALFFFPLFLPVYFLVTMAKSPDSVLSIGLSLFPLTSVTTLALRSMMREIPWWQIGASAAVALASGIAMVWLAGRAFRVGMLRYGKRLRLRDLLGTDKPQTGVAA